MNRSVWVAQRGIAVIVTAASAASFAESYRALLDWAAEHGLPPFWAAIFPLMIDSFILVGELALFIAMARVWSLKRRLTAWAVTVTGLLVSVAGNVGHVQGDLLSVRLTAAVPPVAAFASLLVGMAVLKFCALDMRSVTPVSVTTTVTHEAVTETYLPRHADHLAELPADSARIRYALEITGIHAPRELAEWLAQHGHPVSVENARTVLRRASVNGDDAACVNPRSALE